MATLTEMLERFTKVKDDIETITEESMMQNKFEIIDLLIDQQENEHVDSEGNELRQYSPQYKYLKEQLGKSGKTDFDLTGEFHAEMNLRAENGEYQFDSPALTTKGELKSEWLEKWNGAPIMELTTENKAETWVIIKPTLVESIAEITSCEIV